MVVGGVYISNLETVPVSGRRRFNIMGPDFEAKMARTQATDVLKMFGGEVLPDSDPRTRSVKRVLNRLIPSCGLTDLDWEVYVVDNPDLINAMVVPGGKVFVFTGILPLCQDDDGLAAVLGHEISHVVARHVSEKFSRNIIFYGLAICADLFLGTGAMGQVVIQYLFEMPNGRKQETEADYMGLMLMVRLEMRIAHAVIRTDEYSRRKVVMTRRPPWRFGEEWRRRTNWHLRSSCPLILRPQTALRR